MVTVTLLGVAQDGGLPHAGCCCSNCSQLSSNVACLALTVHHHRTYLIDATPDIKHQIAAVHSWGSQLAGIFLTHLHMGHYAGLMQLGKEAMNVQALPVYATDTVCNWLRSNQPWSSYITDGNITLRTLTPHQPVHLGTCTVTPLPVPHRRDYSDTVAFIVQGGTGGHQRRCDWQTTAKQPAVFRNPSSWHVPVWK